MEKDRKIREFLGMRQEDMAMLLGVTRSQWAMYEIGKRNLPLEAQLKLVEMLDFVKHPQNEAIDSLLDVASQNVKIKKLVENLKRINEHKQLLAKHKLQLTEQKYERAILALRFIRFLETNDQPMVNDQNLLLGVIQLRAQEAIRKNGLHIQAKHRLKLQALQEEEKVLHEMG